MNEMIKTISREISSIIKTRSKDYITLVEDTSDDQLTIKGFLSGFPDRSFTIIIKSTKKEENSPEDIIINIYATIPSKSSVNVDYASVKLKSLRVFYFLVSVSDNLKFLAMYSKVVNLDNPDSIREDLEYLLDTFILSSYNLL